MLTEFAQVEELARTDCFVDPSKDRLIESRLVMRFVFRTKGHNPDPVAKKGVHHLSGAKRGKRPATEKEFNGALISLQPD